MSTSNTEPSADLRGLFASLRSKSSTSSPAGGRQHENVGQSQTNRSSYSFEFKSPSPLPNDSTSRQSSVPPPSFSTAFSGPQLPSLATSQPQFQLPRSNVPSPAIDKSNADQTANLLNLLKFNKPSPLAQTVPPQSKAKVTHSLPILGSRNTHVEDPSALNLAASIMGNSASSTKSSNAKADATVIPGPKNVTSMSSYNQDSLLKLLNRSQAAQPDVVLPLAHDSKSPDVLSLGNEPANNLSSPALDKVEATIEPSRVLLDSSRNDSPIHIFGGQSMKEQTPFKPEDIPQVEARQISKSSPFTYVNPFEHLAASSPRNAKPKLSNTVSAVEILKSSKNGREANVDGPKRKSKESSPGSDKPSSRRKLTSDGGDEILPSVETQQAPHDYNVRDPNNAEALMGIGAPTSNAETVSEALSEVSGRVNRQIEDALTHAEVKEAENDKKVKEEEDIELQHLTLSDIKEELQHTISDVKQELEEDGNQGVLEDSLTAPVAEVVKNIINEAAAENSGDPWESADAEDSLRRSKEEHVVPVYNFPMKPFVAIDIKQSGPPQLSFREDSVMEIARLKKEFDQIDRTLATATDEFIVYAMAKTGGLRLVRQDDGMDQQIFPSKTDRIFNVSVSTAPTNSTSHGVQAVIATSISGTVYWAQIANPGQDVFHKDYMEQHGLIFSPFPAYDDNTSGGQLRTRAKKSSRHPEFFAIGRGKTIQLIFPAHCRNSEFVEQGSMVDSERYFKDRSLKITTGKAGKDFTFSEDDSLIASLDKAGRLRFWDIRNLVDESNASASKLAPIEVKSPLLTYATALPNEKAWPTSLLFVDKLRPYLKGVALRYIIVGMKQNHSLQLWDLGLEKAVQELNFPHEKESDPICSVAYHPSSGILVVGHPTRNSIYFIHLSAPKYNLPPMPQAKYIQRLSDKDVSLPKPESTAIMSGLREYSLGNKGQLRSIEMLSVSSDSSRAKEDEDPPLFELYIMHSKGVTCLNIKKVDLGWSKDSRVTHPVNAVTEEVVVIRELRENHSEPVVGEASSGNGETGKTESVIANLKPKASTRELSEKLPASSAEPKQVSITARNADQAQLPASDINGKAEAGSGTMDKAERKKKKRSGPPAPEATAVPSSTPSIPLTYANAAQRARSPMPQPVSVSNEELSMPHVEEILPNAPGSTANYNKESQKRPVANGDSINVGVSEDFMNSLNKEFKKVEKGVVGELSKALSKELESLYRRFDEDKRVQDAAGAAKQDAILRLVSSTLAENVDKALSRIVSTNMQDIVVPVITNVTASAVDRRLAESLVQQLHHVIPPQLKLALPEAISKAVQSAEVLRALSEQLTSKLSSVIESEFSSALHNTISPAFKNLAINAAQSMAAETERRVSDQVRNIEIAHHDDRVKMEDLTALLRGLSDTIHTMAAAQSEFQHEILKLQRQVVHERQAASSRGSSLQTQSGAFGPNITPPLSKSPEQEELEAITALIQEGRFEEGTIQWLQSAHQAELFDKFFVRCSPAYLQHLSPLVALSVGAAVTSSLDTTVMERLNWLETVFSTVDPRDPDIRDVAPKIMDVLSQRLEGQYMRIAEVDPQNPVLRRIPPLTRQARELRSLNQ